MSHARLGSTAISVTAITATFSVTMVGSMFQGVIVKTSINEVATAAIARILAAVFFCILFVVFPLNTN